MDSLAITDHGALYGIIDFYRIAKEEGVRPIIGCEVYVAPRSHRDRTPADRSPYHLTLLAKDNTGYKNLLQLVTRAHLDGFYYRPRVDRDLLQEHRQGLVALSGCLNGELSRLVLEDRQEEARSWARWAQEVFGGDVYLELQRHEGIPQLDTLNAGLFQLHRELGLPLAATNDFHYVSPEDAPLQDILICIHTNTTINDGKRLKMEGDSFYLKSPAEMAEPCSPTCRRPWPTPSASPSSAPSTSPSTRPTCRTTDPPTARLRTPTSPACARRGWQRRRPGAPNRYQGASGRTSWRSSPRRASPTTFSWCGTSRPLHATRGFCTASGAVQPPASSSTAWASPTWTRWSTGWSSSASSTWSARRCRTSTWTSRTTAGTR